MKSPTTSDSWFVRYYAVPERPELRSVLEAKRSEQYRGEGRTWEEK